MRHALLRTGICALLLAETAAAEQWPQFRGLTAGAVADDPALPETWSATENVAWSVDVPGIGWSSPIVWQDRIFVTSAISSGTTAPPQRGIYNDLAGYDGTATHRWMVYAFDFRTGKRRWEREIRVATPAGAKHLKNTFASATPATDGERLYVFFADAGLYALDLKGRVLWAKELPRIKSRTNWGTGASPVLHKDRVYVTNGDDTMSFLAAFDRKTGNQLWRTDFASSTHFATPFVWEHEQRTEIVTSGTDKVRSFGLDGQLLWELSGSTFITIPTPFAKHGLLYVTSGFPGEAMRPLYAIRPGAAGDISLRDGETSNRYVAWFQRLVGPYHPSPVVYGDYHYTLQDRGFLVCHDARTGKEIYGRQRITADASGFTASPWAYNGKIFALSEDGDTYVIQAGPQFKVLGKNALVDDMTMATPAVAGRSVIIRTASKLFRIAKPAAQ